MRRRNYKLEDYMTNGLDTKVEAIKSLLDAFKYERIVYLIVTVISLFVLFGCALYLIFTNQSIAAVIGMFGSSGAITYTAGRVLRMWSEALRILSPLAKGEDQ